MEYLQQIQNYNSEEDRQAGIALFRRLPDDAERILLQASPPHIYRAIKLNIELYRFTRALDLAVKYKQHLDIVLAYRNRYLTQFNKMEGDTKFLAYKAEVRFV